MRQTQLIRQFHEYQEESVDNPVPKAMCDEFNELFGVAAYFVVSRNPTRTTRRMVVPLSLVKHHLAPDGNRRHFRRTLQTKYFDLRIEITIQHTLHVHLRSFGDVPTTCSVVGCCQERSRCYTRTISPSYATEQPNGKYTKFCATHNAMAKGRDPPYEVHTVSDAPSMKLYSDWLQACKYSCFNGLNHPVQPSAEAIQDPMMEALVQALLRHTYAMRSALITTSDLDKVAKTFKSYKGGSFTFEQRRVLTWMTEQAFFDSAIAHVIVPVKYLRSGVATWCLLVVMNWRLSFPIFRIIDPLSKPQKCDACRQCVCSHIPFLQHYRNCHGKALHDLHKFLSLARMQTTTSLVQKFETPPEVVTQDTHGPQWVTRNAYWDVRTQEQCTYADHLPFMTRVVHLAFWCSDSQLPKHASGEYILTWLVGFLETQLSLADRQQIRGYRSYRRQHTQHTECLYTRRSVIHTHTHTHTHTYIHTHTHIHTY